MLIPKPGTEYFVRVSFNLATDEIGAKKGYEVVHSNLNYK